MFSRGWRFLFVPWVGVKLFFFFQKSAATKKTHPYKEVQQPITRAKQIPPNKKFLKKSRISGHNKK
jgi:hypothetical protein